MKKKKGLVLGGILLLGIGFASISTTLYINGNVNISENTEDFDVVFTKAVVDSVDESSTAISEDGKTITYTTKELQALNDKSVLDFEITNNSSLYDAEVSIVCTSGEKGEYYQISKEVAPTILAKTTEAGKVEVEKIKVAPEDIEESFTCTLNAVAKERTTKGEETVKINTNIVNSDLECLKNKEAGSCEVGTEIRYMVNDTTEKTFHVLHDDGKTLTLQDTESTVTKTRWNSTGNSTEGPLVALTELENATSDWANVNTLNYTIGSTVFKTNAYTSCSWTECTTNQYVLGPRSGKARMITIQEIALLGCKCEDNSCPAWLTPTSTGDYWTMSIDSSDSKSVWFVDDSGRVYSCITCQYDVRAVIEVSKE